MAVNEIRKIYDFLKETGKYYLATVEGNQPRVRPFGTILLFEDRLYILTSKTKEVAKQIADNSRFELSAIDDSGRWIRVYGNLVEDNRKEVHVAMLEDYPHLKSTYTVGGENTQTLYLDNIAATIYSFEEEPEVLKL